MNIHECIAWLETEWDAGGLFDEIRNGVFDENKGNNFFFHLEKVNFEEVDNFPKRLISLMWYMPCFLEWQIERISEKGGDLQSYSQFSTRIHNFLEEALGTP